MIQRNSDIDNKIKDKTVGLMFSGGKDSSFLVYLLKEIYGVKVKAVFVNNGFETMRTLESIKKLAVDNNIPLEIIEPPKEFFVEFYKMLIIENRYFREEETNHICFICNNFIWLIAKRYCELNHIKFLLSGLSRAQLNSGRTIKLSGGNQNAIAEKSSGLFSRKVYESIKKTKSYNNSNKLSKYIDEIYGKQYRVNTIYPYLYHNVSLEEQKSILVEQFNWHPPSNCETENYISSGCILASKVVRELEKVDILDINDYEEEKWLIDHNLMSERKDNIYFNPYAKREPVNIEDTIFQDLGICDFVKKCCKEKDIMYKE